MAQAQILTPAKWKSSAEKISDSEVLLTFTATIEKDWHMFSQHTPDGGSLPTVFDYLNQPGNYSLVGETTESPYKKVYSDIFEVDEYIFEDEVQFQQKIKIENKNIKNIEVYVEYQICKEACIQGDETFTFDLSGMNFTVSEQQNKAVVATAQDAAPGNPTKVDDLSILSIFIISFFSGFAALLTPCVFPMIPMTVSFFTKQSKTKAKGIRNAIFYGISIIIIYVVLGLLVTAIFGADALNALSTNVWFNVIFFIILFIFATSFLGAFEIMLPNSWANKVDKQADRGGFVGILFMALALAIVSFSCTGPIVGTLLVEAASKGGIAPVVGMFGFSLALALPFMLFAMFPGWLNTLPKSGGWLNAVKVSLGFLELALAFKFLSNADLVLQLGWLTREVFLVIWIVIFGAWAMYLFGKLTLPHDSPQNSISVWRLYLALLVTMFTVYLVPGLWGAPLQLISGFPPPMTYAESPYGVGYSKAGGILDNRVALPEGAKYGAHDLLTFTDYETGLAYAKRENKHILLDFTGYACVNCRRMEDKVWSKPEVLNLLRDQFVIISLYVDDKQELPENEQYVSPTTGKKIRTVGNKWSDYQITRYHANAQPYYIVLNKDGVDTNKPVGYVPDVAEYKAWLESGLK
ncbi:thioredoxin family protein [Flavobacterium agricola]|uniref:Thioredoxin family protein n=1 Tax=Flavobacterium agricola TaxID=2870839 RepID=A0ABY6M4H7_9FLAO|nr:thioredoxin family protein [Flavobacterium agricola]UYW02560.1 thioredoxin family protein [Flavobacterium agricola]